MYVSLQADSLPGSPHVDLSDVNQSTVSAIRNFAAHFFWVRCLFHCWLVHAYSLCLMFSYYLCFERAYVSKCFLEQVVKSLRVFSSQDFAMAFVHTSTVLV